MRIALDATYSLDQALSGVGVYSREILRGLAASRFAASWDWFYRSRRFRESRDLPLPETVSRRLLTDFLGSRAAQLFHGLNQRLPKRRFPRQVATFHDLFVLSGNYSTPDFRARFADQAKRAAAGADLIIAVSAFTASQIEEYLHVPAARIRVIHHGVLPRHIPDGIPRENIVLNIGAMQRRKNQASLVRAFRALPRDWKLVLVGSQGYEAEETLREIEMSPVKGRILVTGYLPEEEIAQWYARAGMFAFPSLDEGFGMPVLEAMAAGVPVITGNRSALPEIAGDAAMLIDPARETDLADAMAFLATNGDLRDTLTAKGLEHARSFTWQKAVARTLNVYREMLC